MTAARPDRASTGPTWAEIVGVLRSQGARPGPSASWLVSGGQGTVVVQRLELAGGFEAVVVQADLCGQECMEPRHALAFNAGAGPAAVALHEGRYILRHALPLAGLGSAADALADVCAYLDAVRRAVLPALGGAPDPAAFAAYEY